MHRIITLVRYLTSFAFLGVLLFVYAYLPEQVGISANAADQPSNFVTREFFFYTTILTFIFVNLLFIFGGKLLGVLPVSAKSFFVTENFKSNIISWFRGLGIIINIFIISVVAFFGFFNNADYYHISNFSVFAYGGQLLIILWVGLFFYLLINRNKVL